MMCSAVTVVGILAISIILVFCLGAGIALLVSMLGEK